MISSLKAEAAGKAIQPIGRALLEWQILADDLGYLLFIIGIKSAEGFCSKDDKAVVSVK